MRRGRGLLDDVTLGPPATPEELDKIRKYELDQAEIRVLTYLRARVSDEVFREKVNEILKANPLRRGPKPKDGLRPRAFYELIKAEKKAFGLKNIWETLRFYCEIRNLPIDDDNLTYLHTKYTEGSRKAAKK